MADSGAAVHIRDVVQVLQTTPLHRLDGDHVGLRSDSADMPILPLQGIPAFLLDQRATIVLGYESGFPQGAVR